MSFAVYSLIDRGDQDQADATYYIKIVIGIVSFVISGIGMLAAKLEHNKLLIIVRKLLFKLLFVLLSYKFLVWSGFNYFIYLSDSYSFK